MNNLLPYCGLVDARISASEKYLPVYTTYNTIQKNSADFWPYVKNYFKNEKFAVCESLFENLGERYEKKNIFDHWLKLTFIFKNA